MRQGNKITMIHVQAQSSRVKLISSENTFPNEVNARGVGKSFQSRWANTSEKYLQGIISQNTSE